MATTMSLVLRPLCISGTFKSILSKCLRTPSNQQPLSCVPTRARFLCLSISSSSSTLSNNTLPLSLDDEANGEITEEYLEDVEDEIESVNGQIEEIGGFVGSTDVNLTVKEKKELASYAHSLGEKLKSQLIGKSGVTVNVASSFVENLESNELLKVKIHRTCPGELDDVITQLQEATGSVAVGQIGRTVILYRPSATKMKAEEKKRQARKVYVRKATNPKQLLQRNSEAFRNIGRGHRGSSRFSRDS